MTHIIPYLHFGGNCREAMTFYRECLGGELALQTVAETPMASQSAAEDQNKVVHSSLKAGDVEIMSSDMIGQSSAVFGNTVTLMLNCGSEQEINTLFAKLSAGGKVGHPLAVQFWGDVFGDLVDKFGIRWMLNWTKPK